MTLIGVYNNILDLDVRRSGIGTSRDANELHLTEVIKVRDRSFDGDLIRHYSVEVDFECTKVQTT